MQTDILIVGKGLAGAWLSHYLKSYGLQVICISSPQKQAASAIASGLITPFTGLRYAQPHNFIRDRAFALNAYRKFVTPVNLSMIDMFENAGLESAFHKRKGAGLKIVSAKDLHELEQFNFEHGAGKIEDVWLIEVEEFLHKIMVDVVQVEEEFSPELLSVQKNEVVYKNITAQKIVFCTGHQLAHHIFFKELPFVPVKGEALLIHCPQLSRKYIWKNTFTLVPWTNNLWWAGASFEREFDDMMPSNFFRKECEAWLQRCLKLPFQIAGHVAGVRPSLASRQPVAGFLENQPGIGLLNGLGTKGFLLAPYYANMLARNIAFGEKILPAADVNFVLRKLRKSS